MLHNPSIIILSSVIVLICLYKQDKLFKIYSIAFPLITLALTINLNGTEQCDLLNLQLISKYDSDSLLVAYAFQIVLLAANLYALSRNNKLEIILGSSYAAFAHMALFAGDFISFFVALEMMMIFSSGLIFFGKSPQSTKSAIKYFMTHLVSSNLIIIGIAYVYIQTGSYQITNLVQYFGQSNFSNLAIGTMLTGLIINIAAFPFSGWMVNYYNDSSPTGFIYLITFTTKVSLVIILKLFAGLESLKYIAFVMIFYATIKSVFADNLFKILCLLSISQLGFMLLGASNSDGIIISAIHIYLALHILYKALLSISVAILVDHQQIATCTNLPRIKDPALVFGLLVALAAMVNIPLMLTFSTKLMVANSFYDSPIYYLIMYLGFITVIAIPINEYFKSTKTILSLNLNRFNKSSLYIPGVILLSTSLISGYFGASFSVIDSFKQMVILALATLTSYLFKRSRSDIGALNLIEWLGNIVHHVYKRFEQENKPSENKESWSFESLEKQINNKLTTFHNQQTAIFIVFSIFTLMLISFLLIGV